MIANREEPNANALTDEIIAQIKRNNEVPEDAVSPYNVMKLMEIGFSDVDSMKTLKVHKNNLEAACDYLLNKAEIDGYMNHKPFRESTKIAQSTESVIQNSYEEDTSESSSSEEEEEEEEEEEYDDGV